MLISKLKLTAVAFVSVALLTVGGVVAHRTWAGDRHAPVASIVDNDLTPFTDEELITEQERAQRPQAKDGVIVAGKLEAIDADKNSVILSNFKRGEGKVEKTYAVAKDAKITIDGKDATLADLKAGAPVTVVVQDGTTVVEIRTQGRRDRKQDE